MRRQIHTLLCAWMWSRKRCSAVMRPGRSGALKRFMDHVAAHPDVWVCRRIDIARHWIATRPYQD